MSSAAAESPESVHRRRSDALPCPVCRRAVPIETLSHPEGLSDAIAALAAANTPGWQRALGLCGECLARFREAHEGLQALLVGGTTAILPTPLRLGAVDRFRGRGVGIAFLDSGFFAHPDLVEPESRILKYVDVTRKGARQSFLTRPDVSSWHGMMTSVVACGNGRLSKGLYRGLASEARLVLVKCGSVRRITHEDIRRGLLWVIRHRKRKAAGKDEWSEFASSAEVHRVLDGLGMLVNQAATNFEFWTGVTPEKAVMKKVLEDVFGV